ncbi:hypothetical protein [Tenacibaculum maritimum]|uniref:hypothetical protein n=1 Tax=Tenacibaculum maritimum TaxID=107401 RepID=UPI001E576B52|nr:hypothetical protein [Tenacibaculum maritimum]MCD9611928.1 hypothetical protein [Tenacibaculum maritimum]
MNIELKKHIEIIRLLLSKKINDKIEGIDLIVFLLLNIIEFEIRINKAISNQTAEALTQVSSFQSIEYYYHNGYLDLDKELKELAYLLGDYNSKLKNYELGVVGTKPENWGDYLKERIEMFLSDSSPAP